MEADIWKIVQPLVKPFLLAGTGGVLGYYIDHLSTRYGLTKTPILWVLTGLCVFAAIAPNIGQQLYDFGLELPVVYELQKASYFAFGIGLIGVWCMLQGSNRRWLLLLLLPISFKEPFLKSVTFLIWSTGGFR